MSKNKEHISIGFFGCGNMTESIVEGLSSTARFNYFFFTPTKSKAKKLSDIYNGHFIEKIEDMPTDLDWYFLGFKPQNLESFQYQFQAHQRVVSMLAGTTIHTLSLKLKSNKILRIMPNTPVKISSGVILYFSNPGAFSMEDQAQLDIILNPLGSSFKMQNENDLDLITAFSGCGPALLFEIARIFSDKLEHVIKDPLDINKLITQTFLGTSKLMGKSDLSFEELRNQVTSSKGVTFEALKVLESHNISNIFNEAFDAAISRVNELKGKT